MAGCNNSAKALDYNNQLIQSQTIVMEKMLALTDTFEKSDPAAMSASLKALAQTIDRAITDVSRVAAFDGDTSLRDALLTLLKFYKQISDQEFQEIVGILGRVNPPVTQADVDRMNVINADITKREAVLDETLGKVQQAFAKKYKFEIAKHQLQDKVDQLNQK